MSEVKTIQYDASTSGRKIITYPFGLRFADTEGELRGYLLPESTYSNLRDISGEENVHRVAEKLADYLRMVNRPHEKVVGIFAHFRELDPAAVKLVSALMLTNPPVERIAGELMDFENTRRVMRKFSIGSNGWSDDEKVKWFAKRVQLVSISKKLINSLRSDHGSPWNDWSEGVRLSLGSPDERWNEAVLERLKIELEARVLRIGKILSRMDLDFHNMIFSSLVSQLTKDRFILDAISEGYVRFGGPDHVVSSRLGVVWDEVVDGLSETDAGRKILALFERQKEKVHDPGEMLLGISILRALYDHPLLKRGAGKCDFLSLLWLFVDSAAEGILEISFDRSFRMKSVEELLVIQGFYLKDNILTVRLGQVPHDVFVDEEGLPREVRWTEIKSSKGMSYKSLVLSYLDNDSFLLELLSNPKVAGKPGIVSMIALRCRSLKVLSVIASRRDLYSGFANRDVPINLLMNPAKIPLSTLRKFIHVRYIDKVTLQRLVKKGTQIRDEVRREIERYLRSLG